jgi:hypothetical protein
VDKDNVQGILTLLPTIIVDAIIIVTRKDFKQGSPQNYISLQEWWKIIPTKQYLWYTMIVLYRIILLQ